MSGRYFEDYVVGEKVRTSGRTITDGDIRTWAGLVSDWTELHVNAHMMAASPFGAPIAHGYIAFNLAVGLMFPGHRDWYWPDSAVRTEGWSDVAFTSPVRSGDTLRCERTIIEVEQHGDTGVVAHDVAMVNQDGDTVFRGVERIRLGSRGGHG